ncbi:hypothetical protein GOBAR_DD03217 [Gossypium barbadense]|nr:hypothetical protein GOBAR_DD03217 [Gossypium barbadense]
MGVVKLYDSPKTENPLPDHNGVNMIGGSMGRKIKQDIAERSFEGVENYCEFHHEEGHEIQNVQNSEPWFNVPRVAQPVVIISQPENNEVRTLVMPRIIIKKPATFSYQDSRRVSWNYGCNTTVLGKETAKDQGVSADPEPVKGKAIAVEQKRKVAEPVLSINEPVKEGEAVDSSNF